MRQRVHDRNVSGQDRGGRLGVGDIELMGAEPSVGNEAGRVGQQRRAAVDQRHPRVGFHLQEVLRDDPTHEAGAEDGVLVRRFRRHQNMRCATEGRSASDSISQRQVQDRDDTGDHQRVGQLRAGMVDMVGGRTQR